MSEKKCPRGKCTSYTKSGNPCKLCISVEGKKDKLCWIHFRSGPIFFKTQTQKKKVISFSILEHYSPPKKTEGGGPPNDTKWSRLLKKTKEIYGIVSFHILHSKKYNQTVFLFGEIHNKFASTECFTKTEQSSKSYIRNYLEAIIRFSKNTFFDFYLERHLIIKNKKLQPVPKSYAPNIEAIKELFFGCLEEIQGQKCLFPNVRVHAVNARVLELETSWNFYFTIIQLVSKQLALLTKLPPKFYKEVKPVHTLAGKKIQDALHPIKKDENGKYNVTDILKFFHLDEKSYVTKEINRIDEKKFDHKQKIKNHLLKELENLRTKTTDFYINKAEKVFDVVENFYINNKPELGQKTMNFFVQLQKEVHDLALEMVVSTGYTMDLYTLARIFHKFIPKTQKEKDKFPIYATNIIYYAGAEHIKYSLEILKQFGFKAIYNGVPAAFQWRACIKAPPFEKLQQKIIHLPTFV